MPHTTTLDDLKRDDLRPRAGFSFRSTPSGSLGGRSAWPRLAWTAAIAIALGAAAAAILSRASAPASIGTREIRLVVRDMTYYLEGEHAPNPTLHVRRGEQIRILLRNEDAGMSHDVAIRAWNTGTGLVSGKGDAAVEFTAPRTPGEEIYACTPHGEMMRGTIRVE